MCGLLEKNSTRFYFDILIYICLFCSAAVLYISVISVHFQLFQQQKKNIFKFTKKMRSKNALTDQKCIFQELISFFLNKNTTFLKYYFFFRFNI